MTRTKLERRPLSYAAPTPILREAEETPNRLRRLMTEPFDRFLAPFDRFFPGMHVIEPAQALGWSPTVEISENDKAYLLTAELPGLEKDEVHIDFTDGVLTIRGEKTQERNEEDKERRYHLWERSYGAFQRAFEFPVVIDEANITAEQKDGVLMVHLPKTAAEKKTGRKIDVVTKA